MLRMLTLTLGLPPARATVVAPMPPSCAFRPQARLSRLVAIPSAQSLMGLALTWSWSSGSQVRASRKRWDATLCTALPCTAALACRACGGGYSWRVSSIDTLIDVTQLWRERLTLLLSGSCMMRRPRPTSACALLHHVAGSYFQVTSLERSSASWKAVELLQKK
jgi:hypothetical protein